MNRGTGHAVLIVASVFISAFMVLAWVVLREPEPAINRMLVLGMAGLWLVIVFWELRGFRGSSV